MRSQCCFSRCPRFCFWGGTASAACCCLLLLAAAHGGFGYYRLQNAAPAKEGRDAGAPRSAFGQPVGKMGRCGARQDILQAPGAFRRKTGRRQESGRTLSSGPKLQFPSSSTERPDAYSAIAAALEDGQTLLAGAVRQEGDRKSGEEVRYYNSLLVINDKGELVSAADKQHLVPFGEYLPLDGIFRSLGLSEVVNTPGGFSAGGRRRNITLANGLNSIHSFATKSSFPSEIEHAGRPRRRHGQCHQ